MQLRVFEGVPEEVQGLGLDEFLAWLDGPALFHLPGEDPTRVRMVSGGLHGNEPSGFHAVHDLLQNPPIMPADALLLIGNVKAALAEPRWSHRFLPHEQDLNRIWGPGPATAQRTWAGEVVDYVLGRNLEVFADLHNNSGYNPAYGVILDKGLDYLSIGRAWTHLFVHYNGMELGSLMEVFQRHAPGVVVECGQAGDRLADAIAIEGARRFLTARDPLRPVPRQEGTPPRLYHCLARITVPEGVDLAFAHERDRKADLTIPPNIDRYNFLELPAGTVLAFAGKGGRLLVTDNAGEDVTDHFLARRDGCLHTRRALVPVMMTTDARAAKSDCLLYVAERLDDREA